VRVYHLEVDFLFAARRLVVEVDGYRVLRLSYEQVVAKEESVAAAIRSSA
jgi:very-short-patch-repair endonuclease